MNCYQDLQMLACNNRYENAIKNTRKKIAENYH